MPANKCPVCGAHSFYAKDPEDQYNINEFDVQDGVIVFTAAEHGADTIEVGNDTEIFCNRCAWHDKFEVLK